MPGFRHVWADLRELSAYKTISLSIESKVLIEHPGRRSRELASLVENARVLKRHSTFK